jgi:gliding motility-associated-like protein
MTLRILFVAVSLILSGLTSLHAQGEWVWLKGDSADNSAGSYGTLGVAAPSNNPPARSHCASWKDNQGNFWIYGGTLYNPLLNQAANPPSFADMWMYNPATNEWTWYGGTSGAFVPAVYGTQNVPSVNNTPGARYASITWTDAQGNFWLYGGIHIAYKADLWRFDPNTLQWTWMQGNSTNGNIPPVHGAPNVPAATNTPGGRGYTHATWTDANGRLCMFGGSDFMGGSTMADFWRYDPATNLWVWIGGSMIANASGIYGTMNVPAAGNYPPARVRSSGWKDSQGNFWLFGGSYMNGMGGALNDVWMFDVTTNLWTWRGGSNIWQHPGVQTAQCVSSPNGIPESRMSVGRGWMDACDRFWIYGGLDVNVTVLNGPYPYPDDLWRFDIASNEFTFVRGQASASTFDPDYGSISVPAPSNTPGFRAEPACWTNDRGLWLFGGTTGYWVSSATQSQNGGDKNDMWLYTERPTASFTYSVSSICSPVQVMFSSNSQTGCDATSALLWDFGDPSSGPLNYSSAQSPVHDYLNPGNYNVSLVIVNCLGQRDTFSTLVNVPVGQLQTQITSTPAVCSLNNGTVTITANGNGPFSYLWNTGDTTNSISVGAGIYTVIISDGVNSCTRTDTVHASNPLAALLTTTDLHCYNDNSGSITANISNGSGNYSYGWTPAAPNTSTINQLAAGAYTLLVTDLSWGCTLLDTVALTEPPQIVVNAGTDDTVCVNSAVALNAAASGGVGGFQFTWNPGNQIANPYLINAQAAGTYTVIATDSTGCSSAPDSVTISYEAPIVLSAWGDTIICAGQSATLFAAAPVSNYAWSTTQGGSSIVVSPASTTWYYVSVTDTCLQIVLTDSVLVTVIQMPAINFQWSTVEGCAPVTVHFTDLTPGTDSLTQWHWDFGDGGTASADDTMYTYHTPGLYNVSLTVTLNPAGCAQTLVINQAVNVYPNPVAQFVTSGTDLTLSDNAVEFTNQSTGATQWIWDFGDSTTSALWDPEHLYTAVGEYPVTLIVTNSFGCTDTAEIIITVNEDFAFYVPNTFTPNGDGNNDVFFGYGVSIVNFKMLVFDRWGNLIFESSDPAVGWDGTISGTPVQIDTYVYRITIDDIKGMEHLYIGHVNVIR